ncbi:hypothetical protein F0A16_20940 [Salinicola corii]|uniref:Uncharacterized protein n=1 Tax=Salinicola corii TaxID=2606937 RepID=A0A640W6F6_9GAMM|nr:hypothetical protein F0A16_20940 [Salinicola corii]
MSEKSTSDSQTRQKSAKTRSLRGVNEHFEPIFNAVWLSSGIFQTKRSQHDAIGEWQSMRSRPPRPSP